MLPKWLALPVEHNALTQAEADLLLMLAERGPAGFGLDPVEMAAVEKLQRWSALALMDVENAVAH